MVRIRINAVAAAMRMELEIQMVRRTPGRCEPSSMVRLAASTRLEMPLAAMRPQKTGMSFGSVGNTLGGDSPAPGKKQPTFEFHGPAQTPSRHRFERV